MKIKKITYYETIEDLKQLPDGSVIHGGNSKIRWFDGGISFEKDYIKQSDGLVERTWFNLQPCDSFLSWNTLKTYGLIFYTVDGNK